jgi:hypothetical protein
MISFSRKYSVALLLFAIICIAAPRAPAQSTPNCSTIAMPPPMATLGGPETAGRGNAEVGIAVGALGEIYPLPCGHGGGSDWIMRARFGLTGRLDMGFDFRVENHNDQQGGTAKFAVRFNPAKHTRLEAGIGLSDAGWGASYNGDIGVVIGTANPDRTWNRYASLRLGASHGFQKGSSPVAPGALVPLGVIGMEARAADNIHFVMETGLGGIFSREHPDPGVYIHFSFGILFNVGRHINHK